MKKDPYLSKLDEQYKSGEITLIEKSNLYEKYVNEKNDRFGRIENELSSVSNNVGCILFLVIVVLIINLFFVFKYLEVQNMVNDLQKQNWF